MSARCPKRSQVCGQPMPCRESATRPGTCLWCLERIPPSGSQIPEPPPLDPTRTPIASALTRDGDWYFVDGVRYCARCHTRRCVRQVGGLLPCVDDDKAAPIHPSDLRGLRFRR